MLLKITGLQPAEAQHADIAWRHVARALRYGSMDTLEALQNAVQRGAMQLWEASKGGAVVGGIVTEVTDRPRGRVCVVVAAGGDEISKEGCASTIEQITPWARSLGCEQFEINGRKGWGRHLEGWTLAHTTHRRAIV